MQLSRRHWLWLTLVAIVFGIVCRVAQYAANISFWGDEAYVILNVQSKTPAQLLGPLRMSVAGHRVPPQTAPPVYLWTLKWLDRRFGAAEWSYRLPALLCGLAVLPLGAALAWGMLSPPAATLATALLALSDPLISHTVLVKQYSGDVAAAILLLLIARRLGRGGWIVTGLLAAALLWASETTAFVFGGIALAWLLELRPFSARKAATWLAAVLPMAASVALLFHLSLRHQADAELFSFWAKYLPDPHRPLTIPLWLARQLFGLANYPFELFGPIVLLAAVAGGVWWRRSGRRQDVAMLTFPMLLTLLAAMAQRYPFGGSRVTLFLVPSLLILTAAGLEWGLTRLRPMPAIALAGAGLLLGGGLLPAAYHLFVPRCRSDLRPAVQWVQRHAQPGDQILLVGGDTEMPFHVYWPHPNRSIRAIADGERATPVGRFWCVSEFAPGQFFKKRWPTIAMAADGARPIEGEKFLGRGGAALPFQRADLVKPTTHGS